MDLGLLLDDLLLVYLRVAGIFFVGGIALFNFTKMGKYFSIISLLISLILIIAAVINYFIEKNRIAKLGFSPRKLIDILAYVMIGIAILNIWVIWEVFHTEQTSLGDIAREIEQEVDAANAELISNIRELDEKIIAGNQELINTLKGKTSNITKPISNILKSNKKHANVLKTFERQNNMVKLASLAAVS